MQVIKGPADFAERFAVSRETLLRLEVYAETLLKWQKAINLIAPATVNEMWHRHFADSAQILSCVENDGFRSWVDMGSGAGFPGLVVAAMATEVEGGRRFILMESDAKKAAFLREVARKMDLGPSVVVDIVAERIESAEVSTKVARVDVVSARALTGLGGLLDYCSRFWGDGTVGLFPKGRDAEAEVRDARRSWLFDAELIASITEPSARVVRVRNLRRVSSSS